MSARHYHRDNDESRRIFELPALPSMSRGERMSPATPRLAGVLSILNHPTEEELSDEQRRRKVPQIDSPDPGRQTLPPIVTKVEEASLNSRAPSPGNSSTASADTHPRRILTPVSPSMHQAAGMGSISSATASQSPASRVDTLFATSPVTKTFGLQHRASVGPAQSSTAHSASGSPRTCYSSYIDVNGPPIETKAAPASIPVSASGAPDAYRLMTLETTSGAVQLPVDVQAASRAADEKRRRNAGASARFRQRRKEKERESTYTITRLEHQVRDLREDVDFYRRERDFFRSLVAAQPAMEQHIQRPQSPRLRRCSSRVPLPGPAANDSVKQKPRSPTHTEQRATDGSSHNAAWTPYPTANPSAPTQPNNNHQHAAPSQQPLPAFQQGKPLPHHPHVGPLQQQEQYRRNYPRHPQHQGPPTPPLHHQPPPHYQHHQGPPPALYAVPETGPHNPFAAEVRFNGPYDQQRHERRSQ